MTQQVSNHLAPFGLNVEDSLTRWPDLLAYLNASRPRSCVVIGGAPLVRTLCELYPDMTVVSRRGSAEDDNRHRVPGETGHKFVLDMLNWLGYAPGSTPPNLMLKYNNEPTYAGLVDGNDEYERLSDDKLLISKVIDVYKAGFELGVKIIGPTWAVGWPLDPAMFTPIYEASVKYGHMIGLHVYGGKSLTDDTTLNWFISKADEIAGLCPEISIGFDEFGLDVISQIPGSGPYRRIGVSGRDYGLMHVGSYEILRSRPYIKWANTFCWGALNPRWNDWNVRDDIEFQKIMINTQWAEPEPTPIPVPEPQPEPIPAGPPATMRLARLASTDPDGTLVRSGPDKSWAKVGGIPFAGVDGAYDPDVIHANDLDWVEVWTPECTGWAARQFLDIEGDASDVTELRAQLATVTAERDALTAWQAKVRETVGR